jgi:microcystin-dependent protein
LHAVGRLQLLHCDRWDLSLELTRLRAARPLAQRCILPWEIFMAQPYLGEIQAFAINFASSGFNGNGSWAPCFGQLLSVSQYSALYSLIGTTYGGNGIQNFGLPNLNGHIVASQGQGPGLSNRLLGETWGETQVNLQSQQMASHTHALQLGTGTGGTPTAQPSAGSALLNPGFNGFVNPPSNTTLATTAVSLTGGGQAHDNMQPTLAIVYCIALTGIFPTFG